jgi:hypothetical protein
VWGVWGVWEEFFLYPLPFTLYPFPLKPKT